MSSALRPNLGWNADLLHADERPLMERVQSRHVLIQPGRTEDLETILRIEQESFSAPWTRKMFDVELNENPFGRILTARWSESDDRADVVGYVCFWVVFDEL